MIDSLAGILSLSFASGINLYAAILTAGLGQRFGWISGLPESLNVLSHTWVLIAAGVLYTLEFFADKVPFVTPVWDAIHTFIRPIGAALLAFHAAGNLSASGQVLAVVAGGSLALATHATKAGARIAAHVMPEPATHSLISIAEDFSVVGLVLLAYKYPLISIGVVALLIALGAWLAMAVIRKLRTTTAGLMARIYRPAERAQM